VIGFAIAQHASAASAQPTWTDKAVLAVLAAQLVLLFFGGFVAWRQLRAQFRPFVIVDLDIQPPFIQLVISNLGSSLARDVRFEFTPPLESSLAAARGKTPIGDVSLFRDGIPSFAPGKRLVVLFDNGRTRTDAALPDRFDVTLSYRGDPLRGRFIDNFTLDLGMYREWGAIRRKDVHDVAKEIEKLRGAVDGVASVMVELRREEIARESDA
jgi:hypothetical protein